MHTAIYLVFTVLLWQRHGSNKRKDMQYRVYFYTGFEFKDEKEHFPQDIRHKCEILWRKLHTKKPHNLHSSVNIIRVNKSRRMRWAGCVARKAEIRCMFQIGLVYWSHKPFRLLSCTLYMPYFIQFLFRLKYSTLGLPYAVPYIIHCWGGFDFVINTHVR